MNETTLKHSSWASAGVALLCFFLPFAEITCDGNRIGTVSGLELVTGGANVGDSRRAEPSPPAILAFLSIVVTLALAIFLMRNPRAIAVSAGISLFLTILILPILSLQISSESHDMAHLRWLPGYWVTLLCVAACFASALVRAVTSRRQSPDAPLQP